MTGLPADFPAPTKHLFINDPLSGCCLICGEVRNFGALHFDDAVTVYDDAPMLYADLASPPRTEPPADLYGSPTEAGRCDCGLSLAEAQRRGWRTAGCSECARRTRAMR